MRRRIKTFSFLMVCFGLVAVQSVPVHSDPLDPYIQAANKEGAVTLGVTLRSKIHGKPAGELYIKAFQKHYPFLKVKFNRIGGARDRVRVINEMAGGIFNFDVITVGDSQINTILDAKLPRVIEWEELGIPKFLVHPDNIGVSLRTPVFGIAYNRDLVPDEVAQTFTWETCTDPRWKGKTVVSANPLHIQQLYRDRAWGREKALDYARRWAANKPIVESSWATSASKLMAGAYPIICGGMTRNTIMDLQMYAGAKSLGIVFPEPVPVGLGDLIFVPQKAPHPNAGILFIAWSGTKEAQNILDDVSFNGHPAFDGNDVREVLKGKKVVYAEWKDAANADIVLAEIFQAMGLPVVRSKAKKKK